MKPFDFGVENLSGYLILVDKKIISLGSEQIGGLNRLLQARGKRLRPSIVIAIAYHSGKKIDDKVIEAAAAVELIHLASLIHDDIIDKGTLRWGEPTINAKEGLDSAILAGDYLLSKGCVLACGISAEAGAAMGETIAVLCNGQAWELSDNFNTERTEESLIKAAKGKTSSMFMISCVLGAMVSNLDSAEVKTLSDFAEEFGIYFQYKDDVVDFVATPEKTGKSVGNDIREGNYTLPVIMSLHGKNRKKLINLLKNNSYNDSSVIDILKQDNSINLTLVVSEEHKQNSFQKLRLLKNRRLAKVLQSFAEQC